jgi:hypothetical protein
VPVYLGCWVTQIPNQCLVVSDGPWWSSTVTVARHLAMPDASSRVLRSPAEFLQTVTCSCARASEHLPWGLVPLSGINTWSPLSAGHPEPDDVPPAAFRTLSTACSSSCLARLFRRAAVSRVSLQGLLPPSEPYHLVGGHDPRAVGAIRLPVARRQRTSRRPQGRALVQSPRCPTELFTPPSPVSLPAFFQTPSGYSQRPGPCHRTSSARGLCGAVLRVPRTVTLSVSISLCAWPLSPEALPVRALRPSS